MVTTGGPLLTGFRFFRSWSIVEFVPKVDTPEALPEFVADALERVEAGERVQVIVGDTRQELSPDVGRMLLALLDAVGRGASIDLSVLPAELTTGQVADLLGTSRPTVVKLIDAGELPATRVGTRRRVALADALAYRDRARTRRSEGLAEIVSVSEELDLY